MKDYINSIALLGTSADPPTNGHEALLKGLIQIFPKVVTWASNNPEKKHSMSLKTRHHLLKALVKDINNPQLDIIQNLSSPWAIKTLQKAKSLWPKSSLYFVIGSDLTNQVPTWVQSKELLKKATISIALREGWPINNTQIKEIELLGGQVDLLPLKIPESSSSTTRKNFHSSQVPQSILTLLKEYNLYGLKEGRK